MLARRRSRRAASGFLLFLTVLMPLTLVGVVLSADYSRALLAKRQATNAADVVSMAAATAIVETGQVCVNPPCPAALSERIRIDEEAARERAAELFALAEATGMLPENLDAELVGVTVCGVGDPSCPAGRLVTVSIAYKVPSFFVIRLVSDDAPTGLTGTATRSAQICDPADPARQSGAGCAYPIG